MKQHWQIWEQDTGWTWRALSYVTGTHPKLLLQHEGEELFTNIEDCVRDMIKAGCPSYSKVEFCKGTMPWSG